MVGREDLHEIGVLLDELAEFELPKKNVDRKQETRMAPSLICSSALLGEDVFLELRRFGFSWIGSSLELFSDWNDSPVI